MVSKVTYSDYVFLGIFGLGIVVVFGIQIIYPNPQPSPREIALFTVLELGLSLGFGWILQRIDSRKQFQENLRQFALSAYRRISDIENSVLRIRNKIDQLRLIYSPSKMHELDILRIVTDELEGTVNSSKADWADIIGEEISKKERIEALQKEEQTLQSKLKKATDNIETNQRLDDLRKEIDNLRADLPYLLRNDNVYTETSDIFGGALARELRVSDIVIEHFLLEVQSHSCISVRVLSDQGKTLDEIQQKKPYSVRVEQNDYLLNAKVFDVENKPIGNVVNPFSELRTNDYIVSFITLLGTITKVTDTLSVTPRLKTTFGLTLAEFSKAESPVVNELILKIPASTDDFSVG